MNTLRDAASAYDRPLSPIFGMGAIAEPFRIRGVVVCRDQSHVSFAARVVPAEPIVSNQRLGLGPGWVGRSSWRWACQRLGVSSCPVCRVGRIGLSEVSSRRMTYVERLGTSRLGRAIVSCCSTRLPAIKVQFSSAQRLLVMYCL